MLNLCKSIYLCYPHCSSLIHNNLSSEKLCSPLGITRKTHYIVTNKVTDGNIELMECNNAEESDNAMIETFSLAAMANSVSL